MKILSGNLKGRNILCSSRARPTLSKVRESIFSTISSEDKSVLDLFSGSGSLSFESLSRGANSVVMIDCDREAINIIRKNAKALDIENRVEVYLNKADIALRVLKNKKKFFDIIFIDPPYFFEEYEELLKKIIEFNILSKDGLIIVEHSKKKKLEIDFLNLVKEKRFGSSIIKFLKR